MHINPVWHENCLILMVTGDLSQRDFAEVFYTTVVAEDAGRASEILIDLSGSDIPGSRFIARMVDLVRRVHDRGASVRLRIIDNPPVGDVINLFSLGAVFDSVEIS